MTTKPKAQKFRIRRGAPLKTGTKEIPETQGAPAPEAVQPPAQVDSAAQVTGATTLDEIRKEGLTGRQLRLARRVAQKHGLAVTSDFDAVQQLRMAGIDPFQRNTILELVTPEGGTPGGVKKNALGRIQLPQTVPDGAKLPSTQTENPAENRAGEIRKIQRDLAKRRRRKAVLLSTRLFVFVFLPTFIVGWYFFTMATPMFATKSEFVIQQAESTAAPGGLGGLLQGTSLANQQDSIAVQSYLASRAAMLRLDEDHGFREHFSGDNIDAMQRLAPDATNEAMYRIYADKVKVSYDPTEGILRMEVIAADPALSQEFSQALIGYAEEQVDQLTQRPRDAAMAGARQSLQEAEARRADALSKWLQIQEDAQIADPVGETAALTAQISALEQQRQQMQLTLQDRLNVRTPNQAQVDALQSQIASIEGLIATIRGQISESDSGNSLASRNTELRLAEENYAFQTLQVQGALTAMEAARTEAGRQVRYLSLGVEPIAPDEATYPRAFENTVLAFLIFAGIYLMISLTASILREQVTA